MFSNFQSKNDLLRLIILRYKIFNEELNTRLVRCINQSKSDNKGGRPWRIYSAELETSYKFSIKILVSTILLEIRVLPSKNASSIIWHTG